MTSLNNANMSDGQTTEANTKKVYINPKFHRNHRTPSNKSMHINPLFHQNASLPNNNKPKIYVNPNFVRKSAEVHLSKNDNEAIRKNVIQSTPPSTSTCTTLEQIYLSKIIPKSRYSLVRHNNETKTVKTPPLKVVSTYKINKYKLVSMEQMKNNNELEKCFHYAELNPQVTESRNKYITHRELNSRFKLIKLNPVSTPTKIDTKSPVVRRRLSLNALKTRLKIIQSVKNKIDRTKLKKNNIPCPLFKKYGKCLRKIKGNCEFLHDKKHVAICRKFLKGLCYDKDCLLSHEVTAEKMPTCSFYLRGMCTKDDCPYLHVKLNEKAKICTDFLKGYCDKGVTCLNRHINICADMATKGVCHRKLCSHPHKSNRKVKVTNKTLILNNGSKSLHKGNHNQTEIFEDEKKNDTKELGHRYYKAVDSSSPDIESIKPTRCKLGALPSFILL